MTTIYLVRHAQAKTKDLDNINRPLTEKGLKDREKLEEYFENINIDKIYSSPYDRAVDTISPLANNRNLDIEELYELRERKIGDTQGLGYEEFTDKQWEDLDYKSEDGESIKEVQGRIINVIEKVLKDHKDKTTILTCHAAIMSSAVNYYDNSFGVEDFRNIRYLLPFVVKLVFDNNEIKELEIIDIFTKRKQKYLSI